MRVIETHMALFYFSAVCVQCRKKLDEPVDTTPTASEGETQSVTASSHEEQSSFLFEALKEDSVRILR